KNLVIMNGTANDDGVAGDLPGGTAAHGGGILNDQGGKVTLDSVIVNSCTAAAGPGQDSAGGAIYASGTHVAVRLINGTGLNSNIAAAGNGASATSTTAAGLGANAFGGGAAIVGGRLTLTRSSIVNGRAIGGTGGNGFSGTATSSAGGAGGSASGGALFLS